MSTKIIVGSIAGVGALGGAVSLGYLYSDTKTLKDSLNLEKTDLLDVIGSNSDKDWKILADKHKGTEKITIGQEKTEIKRIPNLNITDKEDTVNFEDLKNKCKSLLDKKVSNIKDLETTKKDVINWCTKKSPILKVSSELDLRS